MIDKQNVINDIFLVIKLRHSVSIGLTRFGLVVAWNFVELCLKTYFLFPSTMLVSAHYSSSITHKSFSSLCI